MSQTTPAAAPLPTTSSMETFLEENFKKILFLCLALIAGLGIYGVINYMNRAKAVEAGEAYASAKTVEDLDVVISKYAGTLSAGNALLQKADLLWEQNKKSTSVDTLKEFTDQYKQHPFLAQALLALGGKLESNGNRSDAKPVFERIVSEFPTSDVAALAQVRLGDLLWADGKEDEAKKIYEGLAAKFNGAANAILDQGQNRLQWITAKLPTKEVDGPPKPKVDPATANPGAPNIPGMPNFKLNSPTGLSPTIQSPTAGSSGPAISVGPNGATSAPITIKPGTATSAPVVVPATTMPAPAAPSAPTKVETPAAPATPVKIEAPAAPAKPAVTVPATPAPIKVEAAPAKQP